MKRGLLACAASEDHDQDTHSHSLTRASPFMLETHCILLNVLKTKEDSDQTVYVQMNLRTVPTWFLCCSSSLFVHRWSHTWRLWVLPFFVLHFFFRHYENTPIQIYCKFYKQNKENSDIFHIFFSKHRLWVFVRTSSARRF